MQISAVDQLVIIGDGDSYASAMGAVYPDNTGNAQYFDIDANNNIIRVTPNLADQNGKRLIFFPYLFSAVEGRYLVPSGQCTFRINNKTSQEAIIAQGTVAQFENNGALVNGSGVWGTKMVNGVSQNVLRNTVFKTMTYTINDGAAGSITLPALAIIGDLPYGSRTDISIFCTCEMENDTSLMAKGEIEIRQMSEDNFKAIISATNNLGSNDQVINSASETITLTASLLKNGSSSGISGATYNWHKFGENGISLQNGSNYAGSRTGQSLVVTEQMVAGNAVFVCDITYQGSVYSVSININDIQDQYAIQKGRVVYKDGNKNVIVENSNVIRKSNVVVYTPAVIDKNTGSASSGWTFSYKLVKNDKTVVATSTGASLEVTGNSVASNGGLDVHITAVNSNI